MVYLLKMVIFHGKLLNNQMVSGDVRGMGILLPQWWFDQQKSDVFTTKQEEFLATRSWI